MKKLLNDIIPSEYFTLYEGLIYTHKVNDSIIIFNNWTTSNFYAKEKYESSSIILIPKSNVKITYQDVIDSIKLMNNLGYFPSIIYSLKLDNFHCIFTTEKIKELINLNILFHLRFNPKYDQEVSVNGLLELYHITFKKYEEKIKKIGLIPKSKSKIENHPERIYLMVDKNGIEILKSKFNKMYPKDTLIKITISPQKLIFYHLRFFSDTTFSTHGIYTLQNIKPECIMNIEDI